MVQFTYDLGFLGFFIRILPAIFLLGLGAMLHLSASRQLAKNATTVPFMVIFSDPAELTEGGDNARMWSLGFYASGLVALALIAFLGGVPSLPSLSSSSSSSPQPAGKVRAYDDTGIRSLPPQKPTAEERYQGGDEAPPEE